MPADAQGRSDGCLFEPMIMSPLPSCRLGGPTLDACRRFLIALHVSVAIGERGGLARARTAAVTRILGLKLARRLDIFETVQRSAEQSIAGHSAHRRQVARPANMAKGKKGKRSDRDSQRSNRADSQRSAANSHRTPRGSRLPNKSSRTFLTLTPRSSSNGGGTSAEQDALMPGLLESVLTVF